MQFIHEIDRRPGSRLGPVRSLLLLLVAPIALAAQGAEDHSGTPGTAPFAQRFHAGAALGGAVATGEFRDHVNGGGGLQAFLRMDLDTRGRVAIRLQGTFLSYGRESERVCLSESAGCRVDVELVTSNNILTVGIGPELAFPVGPVRLYGNALVGGSRFSTYSQVEGGWLSGVFASSENFGRCGFAWSSSGGVEVPVGKVKSRPLSLDMAVTYNGNGRREYLTKGGITEQPDGSSAFDVKSSNANLLSARLGFSVGLHRLKKGA